MTMLLTRDAGADRAGGSAEPPAQARADSPPATVAPDLMPVERVEAELCTLAGQIAAATCRFLVLLADFDTRRGWATWNVRSCAQWLSWRCGLDLRTAREHVRVARALAGLPQVRAAFESGQLSYSKVRAIARVATTANEGDLLVCALTAPAAHVERLTRGVATAQRYRADDDATKATGGVIGQPPEPRDPAYLRWRWDDDGALVLWARLAPQDGARFVAALTRADTERHRDGSAEPPRPHPDNGPAEPPDTAGPAARAPAPDIHAGPPRDAAGALVAMAEMVCAAIEAPIHAPTAQVMVHVDIDTLTTDPARIDDTPRIGGPRIDHGPRIDDGPALSLACAQQLACDAGITLTVHGSDGRTLDLGRRRRRPSTAQRTALWHRDRGCAAPGCGRTRFLHAHHIHPWARGGRTNLDNLVLLCSEHHRALHDHKFTITALGRQRFRFHGPRGATYPAAPPTRGTADTLATAHPRIRPDTIEPDWPGDPLDLPWAVTTLLPPTRRKATPTPTASTYAPFEWPTPNRG